MDIEEEEKSLLDTRLNISTVCQENEKKMSPFTFSQVFHMPNKDIEDHITSVNTTAAGKYLVLGTIKGKVYMIEK